jgi:hypothetical protein
MKFFIGAYCFQRPDFQGHIIVRLLKILIDHQHQINPPFGVDSILEILLVLFQSQQHEIAVHTFIFREHLLPLITNQYLPFYVKKLSSVLDYFICADQVNGCAVLDEIVRFWPRTRLTKQVQLLEIMTETIPHLSHREFAKRIPKIVRLYALTCVSPSSKLAEASLALWDSLEVQAILQIFCRQVFPLIYPWLVRASKEHWAANVRQSATRALAFVTKTDAKLTSDGMLLLETEEAAGRWREVVRLAALRDNGIDVRKAQLAVENWFNDAGRELLPRNRKLSI